MNLRVKTLSGLKWSFTENAVKYLVQFLIGLVLARLLSPAEYGIIGMAMVFVAVSESFVNSGLTHALIRKMDCTEDDYNTMFYTNIGMGLVTFSVLFLSAKAIANFYHNAALYNVVRVMAINLIINSFGLIEMARLTKRIEFKKQTKISLISNVTSGLVGITLAIIGFSYWSLVLKTISGNLLRVVLLHSSSSWKPRLIYSLSSFKELFGFGSKLLVAGLLTTLYQNIYRLVIGKFFSASELGYYTRAEQYRDLPSKNIELTSQRVTYPVLAKLQAEPDRLRNAYKLLIQVSFYITCTSMVFMLGTSREIVLLTVGAKWSPTIPYLQVMSISGMLYSLHSLNLNMLKVKGRSDLYLKLEVLQKIMIIPIIIIGVSLGVFYLLWGMLIGSLFTYFINASISGKLVEYHLREQLADLSPTILHSIGLAGILLLVGLVLPENLWLAFLIKSCVFVFYLIIIGRSSEIVGYTEVRRAFIDQINSIGHHPKVVRNIASILGCKIDADGVLQKNIL